MNPSLLAILRAFLQSAPAPAQRGPDPYIRDPMMFNAMQRAGQIGYGNPAFGLGVSAPGTPVPSRPPAPTLRGDLRGVWQNPQTAQSLFTLMQLFGPYLTAFGTPMSATRAYQSSMQPRP